MKKLERLNKLKELMKINEREILIEFKEAQQVNNSIRENISDLQTHQNKSEDKLLHQKITMNDLTIVRTFNQKVEKAVEELSSQLEVSDKVYSAIAEKLKEAKKKSKSIEKLISKEEGFVNFEEESKRQQQVEENIGYTNYLSD